MAGVAEYPASQKGAPSMVHSAAIHAQIAAAVDGQELQVRVALENTVKD